MVTTPERSIVLGLRVDELLLLQDAREIRVDRGRLVVAHGRETPLTDSEREKVFDQLPAYFPDEEHTVVIARFADSSLAPLPAKDRYSSHVTMFAADCRAVIPLSKDSAALLNGRHGSAIAFAEPEPELESRCEEAKAAYHAADRSNGAAILTKCLVEAGRSNSVEPLAKFSGETERLSNTFLEGLISFTRHDPYPRQPISGLRDFGMLAAKHLYGSDKIPEASPLLKLQQWLKPRTELKGFSDVYADRQLHVILKEMAPDLELGTDLAAVPIYLYWLDEALRSEGLDLGQLSKDCHKLREFVSREALLSSLWLLGYKAGFKAVVAGGHYYAGIQEAHPFAAGARPLDKVSFSAHLIDSEIERSACDSGSTNDERAGPGGEPLLPKSSSGAHGLERTRDRSTARARRNQSNRQPGTNERAKAKIAKGNPGRNRATEGSSSKLSDQRNDGEGELSSSKVAESTEKASPTGTAKPAKSRKKKTSQGPSRAKKSGASKTGKSTAKRKSRRKKPDSNQEGLFPK